MGGLGKNEVGELKFDAPALFLGLKAGGLQSEGVGVQPPSAPPRNSSTDFSTPSHYMRLYIAHRALATCREDVALRLKIYHKATPDRSLFISASLALPEQSLFFLS